MAGSIATGTAAFGAAVVITLTTLSFNGREAEAKMQKPLAGKPPIAESICKEIKFQSKLLAPKIKHLADKSNEEKVEGLFEIFAVKNNGLKINDSKKDSRAPREIDETIEKGGDCSEFAMVIAASLKYLKLDGGALLVRMKGREENDIHVVAYAKTNGERIIIDPQANGINKILDGKDYVVLADLTLEQLKYLYFREYGDYYYEQKSYGEAIRKYEEARCLYKEDPYVSYGLALAYQRVGDLKKASGYAAEFLNAGEDKLKKFFPKNHKKYAKNTSRIIVEANTNEGVEKYNQGAKEYNSGKTEEGKRLMEEAKKLFEEALRIGKENGVIDKKEEEMIKNYIRSCE
jgi:hypothetical protein